MNILALIISAGGRMAGAVNAVSIGAKGAFSYLKIFSFMLFFIIISASAIMHSIEQQSLKPLLQEMGGSIVLTTGQLNEESNKIIEHHGVITEEKGIKKIWYIILTYATFIILFWMTLVWIKLFAKIYERSPFSYQGNDFANYLMGIILFLLFQILFGFFYYSMLDKLHSADDALKVIYTPILSFYLFFVAAYYVLMPIVDTAKNVSEKLPI